MILFRYTIREILTTLSAVTVVLVVIFMSNLFVRYLGTAASGALPPALIGKLMLLAIPQLLGLLLPMGLFFAILLALGRMAADSEIVVLHACGYSEARLCTTVLVLGFVVMVLVLILNCVIGPQISEDGQQLLRQSGTANIVDVLQPGHFQSIGSDERVVYTENHGSSDASLTKLFIAERDSKSSTGSFRIVVADSGRVVPSEDGNGRDFVAENGRFYEGEAGIGDHHVMSFKQYGLRLQYEKTDLSNNVKTLPTRLLWQNPKNLPQNRAEFQWRMSIGVMAMILAFLAVPLSRAKPRQGKFTRLIPGTLLMVVYANLLILMRDWIGDGKLPSWFGMWCLHASMVMFGVFLWFWPKISKRLSWSVVR